MENRLTGLIRNLLAIPEGKVLELAKTFKRPYAELLRRNFEGLGLFFTENYKSGLPIGYVPLRGNRHVTFNFDAMQLRSPTAHAVNLPYTVSGGTAFLRAKAPETYNVQLLFKRPGPDSFGALARVDPAADLAVVPALYQMLAKHGVALSVETSNTEEAFRLTQLYDDWTNRRYIGTGSRGHTPGNFPPWGRVQWDPSCADKLPRYIEQQIEEYRKVTGWNPPPDRYDTFVRDKNYLEKFTESVAAYPVNPERWTLQPLDMVTWQWPESSMLPRDMRLTYRIV